MSNLAEKTEVSIEQQIQRAAADWMDAKEFEERANAARIEAEQRLCGLLTLQTEGTTKACAGVYRVTVTTKLNRALDVEKLADLDKKIPAAILRRLVDYKPTLNLRELRYVEQNEPEHYKAFSQALTVKPAKPSVKVEVA